MATLRCILCAALYPSLASSDNFRSGENSSTQRHGHDERACEFEQAQRLVICGAWFLEAIDVSLEAMYIYAGIFLCSLG